jgi:cation diffusion facilitator family transporter
MEGTGMAAGSGHSHGEEHETDHAHHGHEPHPPAASDHPHPQPHASDEHPHAHASDDHPHPHRSGGDGHPHGSHEHGHGHGSDHGHEHEAPRGLIGFLKSIFAPHSHDAADSVDQALESSARGIRAVQISLVALGATFLLQLVLVFATNSVALLADTIHNLADALTAVPLWIAFAIGRRAATARFTYGFRRAEDLAGLFVLAMITFSAGLAAWESIHRLLDPQPIAYIGLLVAGGLIGFVGNELVALYRIREGKAIGSAALIADGYHARTDGLTSLAVVIGAIGVWLGFPLADPIVGLAITVAILVVLKDAALQVFARLMDAVDPALTAAAERAALQPGVEDVASVRIRWIGHRLEAEAHVVVDSDLSTLDSHKIAESVRHAICHDVKRISDVVVHVDPCTHADADPHRGTAAHVPVVPRRPTAPASRT